MNAKVYKALVAIVQNQPVPEWLQGSLKNNERGNLMRQRKKYKVENGKLYYNKQKCLKERIPIENAPPLKNGEKEIKGVHYTENKMYHDNWLVVVKEVCLTISLYNHINRMKFKIY